MNELTKLEQFALAAMQSLVTMNKPSGEIEQLWIARVSVSLAKKMLIELSKDEVQR